MRLDDITVYQVKRAIELYLEIAYKDAPVPPHLARPSGDPDDPISEQLASLFQEDNGPDEGGARRFTLRLGNARYPFMKFCIQEYLFQDEFFFSVDTHDQMFEAQGDPKLARLMAYNRELKDLVEAAWEGAGLPATVGIRGLLECPPIRREKLRGICILLVDDNAAIQDTIAHMLEVMGYEVDLASDGQEALEIADPARHALILMDVEMPRMDGVEACKHLKSDPELSRIPVLLASAGAVELAQAASPDGYLVKPFRADALQRFLETLLNNHVSGVS
jgi:CheY-like chemotaxis protein